MNDHNILEKVEEYVSNYFDNRRPDNLHFHNLDHAKSVVKSVRKIADHYKVAKSDMLALEIAAWFHGVGLLISGVNPERLSADKAKAFLEKEFPDQQIAAKVTSLILATHFPRKPAGVLEEIICDATTCQWGKHSFIHASEDLRHDSGVIEGKVTDRKSWVENTIKLLEEHYYFTDYGRARYDAGKSRNLDHLKSLYPSLPGDEIAKHQHKSPKPEGDDKKTVARPEKGIETMLRITAANNQRLNALGDKKAHILITVNAIILSAIISLVLRKLDENNFLAYPSYLLLAVSLLSIIYAILATRPPITHGRFDKNDVGVTPVNLLFFGTFYNMELETYTDAMLKLMDSSDILYRTLIHEDYREGRILGQKYKLLRIAYNIFMYGLIAAVIIFILVSIFHHDELPKITEQLKISK